MSQATLLPSEHFSPSVSLHSGRPATTSLEVAQFFGKRHDHVMRSVRDLMDNCPEKFTAPNFGVSEYIDETGRSLPMFILYRDGFMLLVMGYTGKKALAMKLAYIEAFNRMEEELARQKEAARNITQDIVDFPGSISITPSSVADRKPLRALVGSWAKLSNAPFDACWNQLKAAFNLANIKELPQEWIPDALAWVQAKIDALPKALPPQPERLPLYRNGCFTLRTATGATSPARRRPRCWSCGRTGHGVRPASGKSSWPCCGNWTPAAATCSATPCPTWAATLIPCSARSACWTACSRAARKPSSASARPWRTPACTCA